MKKVTLLVTPILALVVVAAAFASTDSRGPAARSAKAAGAGTAAVNCGRTRTIGLAAPITGLAASLGGAQVHWAKYFVARWNRSHPLAKIRLVQGDTQLGVDTAFAVRVAQSFKSNSKILGVVGPAGSQEVVASTNAYKGGALGFVSGSATRISLTDGHTDGSRIGYFFRTVPNDGLQAPVVANYITQKLKWKRVYIVDDQEAYSQGLADGVQRILKSRGVSVNRDSISQTASDFSSTIAKIPNNTQGIYIPWQLAPQAQGFGQQLRAAGKRRMTLFGSDGLFAPGVWKISGSYDSFFPVSLTNPIVRAYARAHGGNGEYFGVPTYVATQVVALAITKACAAGHGKTTRAAVRRRIAATKLRSSIMGFPISFSRGGDVRAPATFGVYQIQSDGSFKRVS